ncbi:MAG: hypothetical protein H6642_07795 [Caldilineaceae bacterium]|nr:hypothetical protein [Caldilineaceae bacterium]
MTSQKTAMIQIPLDIPQVEVLSTEIQPGGKLLIRVESQVTAICSNNWSTAPSKT